MIAAARADAYGRQTGRTPCTVVTFWVDDGEDGDGTGGFTLRCGVTYDGVPREAMHDLESSHRCWRRAELTPRQARRARHKTNRELRRVEAAARLGCSPTLRPAPRSGSDPQQPSQSRAAATPTSVPGPAAGSRRRRARTTTAPPATDPRQAKRPASRFVTERGARREEVYGMGTRVDFYVGRGPEAEWLGSYPFDGYPHGVFEGAPALFGRENPDEPITEEEWRGFVSAFLARNADRATTPDMGWPWPWEDSRTTDYAYALDDGVIWGSRFGHRWFAVSPSAADWGEVEIEDGENKVAIFPDMTERKAVTFGPRSGVMIFGG